MYPLLPQAIQCVTNWLVKGRTTTDTHVLKYCSPLVYTTYLEIARKVLLLAAYTSLQKRSEMKYRRCKEISIYE